MDPIPTLPASLSRLEELAYNLRWTWDTTTQQLFAKIAGEHPDVERINPVDILRQMTPERCHELESDPGFIETLNSVTGRFDAELNNGDTWFSKLDTNSSSPLVAYFSAEFGLSEQLPIYSGGLGVLAGDHLKSASALGLPLVAIGLFYYDGYFRQHIGRDGWQQDSDVKSDPKRLPLRLVRDDAGQPVTVSVDFPGRVATARIWQATIGRIPLYLMDARLPDNQPEDQAISARLYGGDQDMRIRQEIMLGIGGLRALEALGLSPAVSHLNEGHSSFLLLEQIRKKMSSDGVSFTEALAETSAGTIFTTHTPVAAGHDYFSPDLMQRYFAGYAKEIGLDWQDFLSLGRTDTKDHESAFGMTELAMRTSSARNAVSKLHGDVTRRMWTSLWPELPVDEIPVGHVTNGVHMATWIAPEMASLFDDYVTAEWRERPTIFQEWKSLDDVSNESLWQAHQQQKPRLVETARHRLHDQLIRFGASDGELESAAQILDPDALTIGFARRFTAYKRATLLMSDIDRLAAIVASSDRPVQFIFSGKAHPRDVPGKTLIQRIATIAKREPFKGRLLFLENYDMAIARRMVAGVDVWLNNPTRPQEASGTSGMKAAANGVLNFSILDGWWAEAWETAQERGEPIGWSIDPGYEYDDPAEQNAADAIRLYEVLEQEIIPAFYNRGPDGLPDEWIERMKASIRCAVPDFSGLRMVSEYTRDYYLPAAARVEDLASG
ncbi:MAG: alpha-glucan family phosphorylase [Thermomicrobiales bacterium]